jgi:hypothetical protein
VRAGYRLVNFLLRARQRALAWDGRALGNIAAVRPQRAHGELGRYHTSEGAVSSDVANQVRH